MTIANLFAKHKAGEISKEKFLYEARKDSNLPWITNMTSYSDAINILKSKNIISETVTKKEETMDFDMNKSTGFLTEQKAVYSGPISGYMLSWGIPGEEIHFMQSNELSDLTNHIEQHKIKNYTIKRGVGGKWDTVINTLTEQKDLHLTIDRLNPILVDKAVDFELEKVAKIDSETFKKTTEKVVKKLQKDPHAYDDVVVSNATQIHKTDEKLKMTPVKGDNLVDENNQMKKIKGVEVAKSNVKTSKKENKKGKPKGVKEMSSTAKAQKGLAIMESLLSFVFKKKLNEDVHHSYARGQQVNTPDGDGIIDAIVGDTLSVKFDNDDIKDYQMNAIEYFKEMAKEPKEEPKVEKYKPEAGIENVDKRDLVIKKIMELLKKKKAIKKEATTVKTNDPKHNADVLNKINKIPGKGKEELKTAFNKGETIDI